MTETAQREGRYCGWCGQYLSAEVPFHTDPRPEYRSPMSPFCSKCGGTLRLGFVRRVTCECTHTSNS